MKIAYIAPRFHTNQRAIVKGWLDRGDQVLFISQYRGRTEDYSQLKPFVLGYSPLFKLIDKGYRLLNGRKHQLSSNVQAFQMKFGFPPVFRLRRMLKEFEPDLVIVRERSVYTIAACCFCRSRKRFPAADPAGKDSRRAQAWILYTQNPLWDPLPPAEDPAHRLVRALTPRRRMTPVEGKRGFGYKEENAACIPFVVEPAVSPEDREHFRNGVVNLLCIAKYEERKNLRMLLRIVNRLRKEYPLHLTAVGEVSTPHHRAYLAKVQADIRSMGLEDTVTLLENQSMAEVYMEYKKADLFVLPSTGEFASVSQLEAMACSLPVICSDTNGSACCVTDGENGYLFRDRDETDLEQKLRLCTGNRESLLEMGKKSYETVEKDYNFEQYRRRVMALAGLEQSDGS